MRQENALISDKWKKIQERKERQELFGNALFAVGFIALFFTMMVLKTVYGG